MSEPPTAEVWCRPPEWQTPTEIVWLFKLFAVASAALAVSGAFQHGPAAINPHPMVKNSVYGHLWLTLGLGTAGALVGWRLAVQHVPLARRVARFCAAVSGAVAAEVLVFVTCWRWVAGP